jgi:hypothetical protein
LTRDNYTIKAFTFCVACTFKKEIHDTLARNPQNWDSRENRASFVSEEDLLVLNMWNFGVCTTEDMGCQYPPYYHDGTIRKKLP